MRYGLQRLRKETPFFPHVFHMPRVIPKGPVITVKRKEAGYPAQLDFADEEPTISINRLGDAERSKPSTIETILLIVAKLRPKLPKVTYDDFVEPNPNEPPFKTPKPATVIIELPLELFLQDERAAKLLADLKELAKLSQTPRPTSADEGSTLFDFTIEEADTLNLMRAFLHGDLDVLQISALRIRHSDAVDLAWADFQKSLGEQKAKQPIPTFHRLREIVVLKRDLMARP